MPFSVPATRCATLLNKNMEEVIYTKYSRGFYQVDARIFDQGLTPIQLAVYSYLVSCAGSRGSCFPSVRTIARKCSCSESAARSAVKELVTRGLISREYGYRENRYGVRQQTSNTYHIKPIPVCYGNGEPRYTHDAALPF